VFLFFINILCFRISKRPLTSSLLLFASSSQTLFFVLYSLPEKQHVTGLKQTLSYDQQVKPLTSVNGFTKMFLVFVGSIRLFSCIDPLVFFIAFCLVGEKVKAELGGKDREREEQKEKSVPQL
jgi:hypothetical protein